MARIWTYLRGHRWQRLVLTALVGMIAGLILALLVYPHVQDWLLIRDLGSDKAGVRDKAMFRAELAAKTTPRTLRKLLAALDTDDDALFGAVATSLDRAGKFRTPDRDPALLDRLRAINLDNTTQSDIRRNLLSEVIVSGRGNRYTRRVLASTARDEAAQVRQRAALLAGRLGDDDALARLLDDPDAAVRGAAAIAAGLTGRGKLAGRLAGLMNESSDVNVISSAAYALARLKGGHYSERIGELMKSAKRPALRDRLLHVLTLIGDDHARVAVRDVLESAGRGGKIPPAMAMLAAGRLGIAEAAPHVRAALAAAGEKTAVLESQLLAAIETARRLDMRVRGRMYMICERFWGPRSPFLLVSAATELARQADLAQDPSAAAPSRLECIRMLQDRARFAVAFVPDDPASPRRVLTTPVPSAAAAAALWRLGATKGQEDQEPQMTVREAAAVEGMAPGEYLAWHVAPVRGGQAYELGMKMLPPLGAARELRVYNDSERATGAMLLALSARSDGQKKAAADRIIERLEGNQLGGEDVFAVAGAYRCSLLMLGRRDFLEPVIGLLGVGEFSRRQVIAALCVAGRREGLDWLLWNHHVSRRSLVLFYLHKGVGEVLSVMAPELPGIDVCGTEDLRLWQARILQDYYGVNREKVRVGRGR